MKNFHLLFRVVLCAAFLLSAPRLLLAAQSENETSPAPEQEKVAAVAPDLADIIPLASRLQGRHLQLENKVKGLPDVSALEKKFQDYQQRTAGLEAQLRQLLETEGSNPARIANLNRMIWDEKLFFELVSRPLVREIRQVDAWKKEWQDEKNLWNSWKLRLLTGQEPEQLRSAFAKAQATIDSALKIIEQQLETMLQLQTKGGAVKVRIYELEAQTQALLDASNSEPLLTVSAPLFSREYLSQFNRQLWRSTLTNMNIISWPDILFWARHGWVLVAQLSLAFILIFTFYRNRQPLQESAHWKFLGERHVTAGIFIAALTLMLSPNYQIFPANFRLVNMTAGGISFILLLNNLLEDTWKRQAAYGVVILFVLTAAMMAINLPLTLYRLFTLLSAILALYFLRRWSKESTRNKDAAFYTWGLRLGAILAGVIVVAELWGMDKAAKYLFQATVISIAISLAFLLFMHIIHGGLHWLFHSPPVWNIKLLRSEVDSLERRVGFIINTGFVIFILLPVILASWGLFGSIHEAVYGFFALGFDLGEERISVGLIIAAVGALYVSILLSWILPKVILDEKVAGAGLERGVRISVGRLIQYFIVFVGFIITIMVFGLDLTKLTIILSALGVGIGFGLQGIVNNFISGIILLFERPVRIGDTIEMTGIWAEIKSIGLRSTTVRTFDEAEVIIPNADLVSNQVTNWTLTNRLARLVIPVGVAYGSDVPLVIETLMACAGAHDLVAKSPPPQVLFRNFGESSLNFELRVWITEVDNRLPVASELHQEIDRRFREAGIEIAFPQRDLHLRTIAPSVIVQHSDAG